MDTLDFEKEFSEWVLIRDYRSGSAPASSPPESSLAASPRNANYLSGSSSSGNVNGDVIFSLPEHIILSVLHYSSTDPHALYRTVSLVCRQFSALAKKLPMNLVFRSTMTQRLPDCKIIALTVTTPISSEVIRLIGTKYASSLRILKISHLNTTRETQLNEDSLVPLRLLTKLKQLSLAWKASPNLGPKSFAFLAQLTKLKKLSLEIYEKDSRRTNSGGAIPFFVHHLTYAIPPSDHHEHSNNCPHCPYSVITPLARAPLVPSTTTTVLSPQGSPNMSLTMSSHSSSGVHASPVSAYASSSSSVSPHGSGVYQPQALKGMMMMAMSPVTSPVTSPSGSPTSTSSMASYSNYSASSPVSSAAASASSSHQTNNTTWSEAKSTSADGLLHKATSAGLPHTSTANNLGVDPASKRAKMIQSSPGQHVRPVQTITTAGTSTPTPVTILKLLADLTELEELKLSNWRDFGPLFLLAPLTKIATLTIKGRPSDLMTDGASVADASRHFLFLATLSALRSLTLAWVPPCLPQLTRLSNLDLSQAPNLDDDTLEQFSKSLLGLKALCLNGLSSGGQITNAGVRHLSNLQYLTFLDLSHHHQVTSEPFGKVKWQLVDLRLNHTSVATLRPLAHFSPTLLHLHLHGCELLPISEVALMLPNFTELITFRFINGALSTSGGIDEHLLCSYLKNDHIVALCDRVVMSNRAISILPGLKSLQYIELVADSTPPRNPEAFEPLSLLPCLQSINFTDITINANILGYLGRLPLLVCLTANKVDESSSSTPKAIHKLASIRILSLHLSSTAVADLWMKYVVRLPNLTHYSDGQKQPGDLSWATRRRLYLEWHPRILKSSSRTNNCTIS